MGTHGIGGLVTDVGHDGDEDMLLDGEGAGVEGDAEDLDVGEEACPEATEGEGEQLGDNLEEEAAAAARSATSHCAVRTRAEGGWYARR